MLSAQSPFNCIFKNPPYIAAHCEMPGLVTRRYAPATTREKPRLGTQLKESRFATHNEYVPISILKLTQR